MNQSEQQSIQKRNEIVEEYIKSLDNKQPNSNNINDDEDDPFSIAVSNLQKQKALYAKKPLSQSKPKRFSIERNAKLNRTANAFNIINQERSSSKTKSTDGKGKRRNRTARNISNKLYSNFNINLYNNNENNRIKSTNKNRQIENIHNYYYQMMNNPSNPYSTNWTNKFLTKNYNMKIGVSGFLNGVPVVRLNKKKERLPEISKKELKEKLNRMNIREIDDNIPNEVLEQFNTNKKNFFKTRKDIVEESFENEQSDDEDKENKSMKPDIQFPLIYRYFEHK